MSKHKTIRRYTLIIEKIKQSNHPSFEDIKNHLYNHGFDIGDRTIQRDFNQIRYEFGIEITYNKNQNGYYIDFENSVNSDSFFRFLEIVNTSTLLAESINDGKNALNYISFDSNAKFKGLHNLKELLFAAKNHRKITFNHFSFYHNKIRKYSIKPYLLKEYENRWYVVGLIGNTDHLRTFGIDRIENLEIKTETFTPKTHINPQELFAQTIGLVYSENTLQEIILSFTPLQGKYIQSLPIHTSQRVIIDDENEYRISITVIPNYELNQLILKHGNTVKVIKPSWLANEIKENLHQSLEKYL